LDERHDNSQLNGKLQEATFEIAIPTSVQILRLRQTGLNDRGDHMMAFMALEFFGRFFKSTPLDCRLLHLRSLREDVAKLKQNLIETSVLPGIIAVPGKCRFDGIISRLTRDCGGNVADRGIVSITASSVVTDFHVPRNVADFDLLSNLFNSKNQTNSWIEWDFKTGQIEATHYSIRTHDGEPGGGHLRHWVLEGRNGDEEWIVLDERPDDSQLNGQFQEATFEIAIPTSVQILRLRQTALNRRGDHALRFAAFEIFGNFVRYSLRR
jgi:hypothetical protein